MSKNLVRPGSSPFGYRRSDSFGESQGFKTLLVYHNDGEGAIVPPLSVLKVRVEKEEVPLSNINFVS